MYSEKEILLKVLIDKLHLLETTVIDNYIVEHHFGSRIANDLYFTFKQWHGENLCSFSPLKEFKPSNIITFLTFELFRLGIVQKFGYL